MVFFELRWNYSPLKEKAVLLPDGLFVFFVAKLCFAPHRYGFLLLISGISFSTIRVLALNQRHFFFDKNLSLCCACSPPLQGVHLFELLLLLMQAARHASRPRGLGMWTKFVGSRN
jgi:hypothetical protein